MAKAQQADLFGPAPQGDLFGDNESVRPKPQFNLDLVRARIHGILAEARAAQTMPWDRSKQSLYKIIMPQFCGHLDPEEGNSYLTEWQTEWDRLSAA